MSTILVVDDRAVCRDFLVKLLGYAKHTVIEAGDGVEALKTIHEKTPELIITDLLMPTMNGYELVQKIKAHPKFRDIPIIFYTASFLIDEAKLLADTCDVKYVLFKPSEPQVILEMINEALHISEKMIHTIKEEEPITEIITKSTELKETHETFDHILKETQALGQEGEKLLKISDQLACTFNHLNKVNNQLLAMSGLCLKLLSERNPKCLLSLFCDTACQILESHYCFLGILDNNNNNQLKYFFVSSKDTIDPSLNTALVNTAIINIILNSDQMILHHQIDEKLKAAFPPKHPTPYNFLGTRLITLNHLYGFVYFINKKGETPFTEMDSQIVKTLASEIAMLYENIELYNTIQRHATQLQLKVNKNNNPKKAVHP